jgi:hypothetical protein
MHTRHFLVTTSLLAISLLANGPVSAGSWSSPGSFGRLMQPQKTLTFERSDTAGAGILNQGIASRNNAWSHTDSGLTGRSNTATNHGDTSSTGMAAYSDGKSNTTTSKSMPSLTPYSEEQPNITDTRFVAPAMSSKRSFQIPDAVGNAENSSAATTVGSTINANPYVDHSLKNTVHTQSSGNDRSESSQAYGKPNPNGAVGTDTGSHGSDEGMHTSGPAMPTMRGSVASSDSNDPTNASAAAREERPRRRTIEQEQADAWDRGEFWQPPVYNPEGESSFIKGVREDKVDAQDQLNRAENDRYECVLPDAVWDQLHSDPIGHANESIKRRKWMIAIYEDAYLYAVGIGMSNLASHAYAQIQLDKWRDKSLQDFEQAFGTHFAQLGQAISGDSVCNLQKLVAEGVPVTVVRTATTAAETASNELGTGTTASTALTKGAPPVQGENASILLANDHLAARCAKSEPTPGWYNVFIHGNEEGFGLKISGKTVRVGVKTVKDAMIRTGYEGGPVILNSCKTGSFSEGAAQQLADELGETVLASTTKVGVTKAGKVITRDGGVWKLFFPTLSATP